MSAVDFNAEELKGLLKGRVLLLCHHNADPDSVCSAYAVQELALALDPSVDARIFLPGGASSLSRRIMEEIDIVASENTSLADLNTLVVLDTATLSQLEEWGKRVASAEAAKVFIDHHTPHPEISSIASLQLVDEDASSTCEVVYGLYEAYGLIPSPRVARALLAGIVYDSKHFSIGTVRTFHSVTKLIEVDGPLEAVLLLLVSERDRSESIARLKAAQRMQLHQFGGWTFVTSHVSSYQASAARGLLGLGADVVIVVGRDRGELRASLRATDRFYEETSVHLGRDVAMPLGEEFGGAGSGHTTAAGLNGRGNTRAMMKRAVELITDKLKERSEE